MGLHDSTVKSWFEVEDVGAYEDDNKTAWKAMATHWEEYHSESDMDRNDMFTQCLLPVVAELSDLRKERSSDWQPRVLDLGAGSGIIARMLAREGALVTGLDYSQDMMEMGRRRAKKQAELEGNIYDLVDILDYESLVKFMESHERYDIVTLSPALKSLPTLKPLAKAIPLMTEPDGRIAVVDLHPAFPKSASHQGMEIYTDPMDGKQSLSTYINVPRYLQVPPTSCQPFHWIDRLKQTMLNLFGTWSAMHFLSSIPGAMAADPASGAALNWHRTLSNISWISGATMLGLALSYSLVQNISTSGLSSKVRIGVFAGWLVSCAAFLPSTLANARLLGPISLLAIGSLVIMAPCAIALAPDVAKASDAVLAFGTCAIFAALMLSLILQRCLTFLSPRLSRAITALCSSADVHSA